MKIKRVTGPDDDPFARPDASPSPQHHEPVLIVGEAVRGGDAATILARLRCATITHAESIPSRYRGANVVEAMFARLVEIALSDARQSRGAAKGLLELLLGRQANVTVDATISTAAQIEMRIDDATRAFISHLARCGGAAGGPTPGASARLDLPGDGHGSAQTPDGKRRVPAPSARAGGDRRGVPG